MKTNENNSSCYRGNIFTYFLQYFFVLISLLGINGGIIILGMYWNNTQYYLGEEKKTISTFLPGPNIPNSLDSDINFKLLMG